MTWDITALGLPLAGQPFERGTFRQHLEIPGVWLERGTVAAHDTLLMDSPLGLAGQRCPKQGQCHQQGAHVHPTKRP